MPVLMNTFWSNLGVVSGNTSATNQYDLWKGITFNDGFVCASQYDFFTHLGTNRYEFFKSYNSVDSNIVDETTFYQNTSDPDIWDYKTFYENAGQYIVAPAVSPTPTPTNTETPTQTPTPSQTGTLTPTPTLTNTPTPSLTPGLEAVMFANISYSGGYSTDMVNWSQTSDETGFDYIWSSVATDGTTWKSLSTQYDFTTSASTNVIATSTNGIGWTSGATQAPIRTYIGNLTKIGSYNNTWIINGNSSYAQLLSGGSWTTMAYSNDGLNYTPVNITIPSGRVKNQAINQIAYGNGLYIAVGASTGSTSTQSRLLYSNDAINWTGTSTTFTGFNASSISSIIYANGRWVLGQNASNNTKVMASTDGFNWTASTNATSATTFSTTIPASAFIYFNNLYIAYAPNITSGATAHLVNYSSDGLTWFPATSTKTLMGTGPSSMAIYNNKLYASGRFGSIEPRIWETSDGINWSVSSTNFSSVFPIGTISNLTSYTPLYPPEPTPTPTTTSTETPTQTPTNTATPTLTPTTTQGRFNELVSTGTTQANACSATPNTRLYSNQPLFTIGQKLYYDSALTNQYLGFSSAYVALNGQVALLNWFGDNSVGSVSTCPTPTPTQTPTQTSTPTPTPSPVIEYHLQTEETDNILTEDLNFIDIEN